MLNVSSGPALQPYASWAGTYALGGSDYSFDADPDHDGIHNGLEWILGGSPLENSAGVIPQVGGDTMNLTLSFTRNDGSEASSTLLAQWATDLASTWTDVVIGSASSGPDGNNVTVAVTENSTSPDSVLVTIPRSNGAQGRLFMRLKATMP